MIPLFKDPSAGAIDAPENRLAIVYAGNASITLNDPASPTDDSMFLDDIAVSPITDAVMENKQGKDGMEAYQVFKNGLMIRMHGIIKAPTQARLFDKAEALAYAFDPALLSRRFSPSSLGFRSLAFSVPTEDTVTFPSGLMPSQYFARAMDPVHFARSTFEGYNAPFEIDLIVRDPRRYLQTLRQKFDNGAMDNLVADYPSWPMLTIVMTAAGNAAAGFQNAGSLGGAKTLTLNLSGLAASDVVVVDMERRLIKRNGITDMSLYVSGDYWMIEPQNNTQSFNFINSGGISQSNTHVDWYPAFVK